MSKTVYVTQYIDGGVLVLLTRVVRSLREYDGEIHQICNSILVCRLCGISPEAKGPG